MADQRSKALFFIFLLLSAHAFRIETEDADASRTGDALNSTARKLGPPRYGFGSRASRAVEFSHSGPSYSEILNVHGAPSSLSITNGVTNGNGQWVREAGGCGYTHVSVKTVRNGRTVSYVTSTHITDAAEHAAPGLYPDPGGDPSSLRPAEVHIGGDTARPAEVHIGGDTARPAEVHIGGDTARPAEVVIGEDTALAVAEAEEVIIGADTALTREAARELARDAAGGGGKYGGQHSEILAAIEPYWPLLLAAGVVGIGGLYLYHRHRMNGPVEATFCPVSSWQADPVDMLVGPAAHEAFGDRLSSLLSEDNNRGMPKCHGLQRHRLRSDCDGDVDCKRQACRQMCCDHRDCTFYQFNTIDSTDNCWLGSRSRLDPGTCESPFFGETCTTCRDRQVELWPQIHEDNMKCHSALLGFTGFHVENQYECQAHALEQGHPYYQYDAVRQKCETEATCDNPSRHTMHNWQIFSNENMPPPQPAAARPPPDQEVWQFEPFLLHENRDMTTVQLAHSERCGNSGDVTCMRDACRAQCLQHDWCIHYQFESGGDVCQLGATHVIDEDDVGMWFGGILTENRLCAADEYKCPSSHNCVQNCGGECDGHSREGPDGWCVRSAVENIVDEGGWTDNYHAHSIDAWCRGLERAVVTVSAGLGDGQTGADICRAACSADSNCALWQMYPRDAERSDLSEGDHVRCWLGMEDQLQRPRFTCTGRSPKRWRLLSAPRSEAVMTRGCRDSGKVACVLSQRCVDLCADECPGFDITDTVAGICQPPPNADMMTADIPMDMALTASYPGVNLEPENALLASNDEFFAMSVNLNNVIDPGTFTGDTTALCDVIPNAECDLIDGACVCEYDEDVDCMILFGHPERLAPVMAVEGMMLMSQQGCSCEGRTCTLRLLSSVPPVKTSERATAAVQLRASEAAVCEESTTCPNMNRCSVISYGAHGCGYECESDDGKYWCSDRCACNMEEAVAECVADVMCPDMDSCNPISYGEYGCGYGCMRGPTFFFCNSACTVCNE